MTEANKTVKAQGKSNEKQATEKKLNYGVLIAYVVLMIAAYFLLDAEGIISGQIEADLSFLIIPFIIFLTGAFIGEIFNTYLTGTTADMLKSSLLWLFSGTAIFLLLSRPPLPTDYQPTGYIVLLVIFAVVFYHLFEVILAKRFALKTLVQAAIIFLAGLASRTLLMMFAWGNNLEFEISDLALVVTLADLLFWSLTLLSIMLLLSLLALSRNHFLTMAGFWFGNKPALKGMLILIFTFYFLNLRSVLEELYYPDFQIYEWLSLSIVFIALIFLISKNIKNVVKLATYAGWGKHRQNIDINKGDQLLELANHVDQFLEQGDKQKILIYIINESLKRKLSIEQIQNIVSDFIDYQDEPESPLTTRYGKESLRRRNINKRKLVLEEMVAKFGQLGGDKIEDRAGTGDV